MAAERDSGSKSTNQTSDTHSATTLSPQAGATGSGLLFRQLQKSIGNRATMQLFSQTHNKPPIQMKAAQLDAFMGAHMREYKEDASGVITVDESKQKGDKIKNKQPIEDLEVSDSTGKWGKIKVDAIDGFIRKDKIVAKRDLATASSEIKASGSGSASAFEDESSLKDNIVDNADMITKGTGGKSEVLKDASGTLKDDIKSATKDGKSEGEINALKDEKDKTDYADAQVSVASSVFDTTAGIAGLVNMVKTFKEADTGSKKAAAVTETIENTQKTFTGIANMVDNSAKVSGKSDGVGDSTAVAGWAGSVGDGIAAIKSAFFAVKKVFELFKEGIAGDGVTKGEALRGAMDVVNNGLQSAQSAVKTVKSILEILDLGTGNLAKVVPGIGVAVSAVKITIQVYDMIQSQMSKMKMTEVKREFKEKYKANTKVVIDKSKDWWRTTSGTDKKELAKRKAELEAKARAAEEEQELADIQEYELALEMKYINQKRMNRAGISLGLEMLSMAGDIATLSGAGAAAGVSMKAVASGAKVGMGVARRVKQYGRDKAAQAPADSAWRTVFDAEKSSSNKHGKRNKDVDLIFSMVSKLPEYKADDEAVIKQYQRIENFIEAAGCSTKELYKLNGNVDKQRELMMESMKKRE
ncbi:MAG: hypothetical protein WDZ91_10490 [Paenibacillaceae bacterium]